jgi:tetratricopeptide (TPR) repeat protein
VAIRSKSISSTASPRACNHALGQYLLGAVYIYTNRATEGIARCEHALALNRNLAAAHSTIGIAKYFTGRAEETESHVLEALRLSPRDTSAYGWMTFAGVAKLGLSRDEEAVLWLRRAIETNQNTSSANFFLAAALAQLGQLDKARAATNAGLAIDPTFTIRRFRSSASSDNPTYLAQRERIYEGMNKAGLPEA